MLFGLFVGGNAHAASTGERSGQQKYDIAIPALNAAEGLNMLAEQTDSVLLFPYKEAKLRQANAVRGRYTLVEALRILLQGSGLDGSLSETGAIRISVIEDTRLDHTNHNSSRREAMKTETGKSLLGAVLGFLLGTGNTEGAVAQEFAPDRERQPTSTLEEIVVTAQKREQSLQDVGISVTAFSGDQLKSLGITDTSQIHQQIPGLMVTDYGGGATTVFTIRGSAQLDFADLQEAPVAVYSDGAYNPYLSGVGFAFYDIERVEVLRGPQGTLFGRNATGGVVHIISARPTEHLEGYLEATGGEYGQHRFEGAISGPLNDVIAARLAMVYHDDDGYMENLVPGEPDGNDINNFSGRAQLLLEPNEDMSLLLLGHWSTDDTNGQLFTLKAAAPRGADDLAQGTVSLNPTLAEMQAYCAVLGFPPGSPPAPGFGDCFGTPDDGDPHTALSGVPAFFERDHYGLTAEFNWDVGGFHITNILNYQDLTKRYLEDDAVNGTSIFLLFADNDASNVSEEFRLSWGTDNAEFVVGAYYLNIDSKQRTGATFDAGLIPFSLENHVELDTETWAVFGQVDWNFAPQWSLIAGLRWSEDDKDFRFNPSCPNALGIPGFSETDCTPFVPPGAMQAVNVSTSRSEGDWSGVLELDWRPNDDWLLYAKVSRGHKAGGYNGGPAAFFTVPEAEFDGEILWAYEGGFKASIFGGSTRVNASVFHYDYNDFQSFIGGGLGIFLGNVDARNTGAEIEIVTSPWHGLEFLFGIGIQDAEQKDFEHAGVVRDRPMPNAPDLMLNGMGRYEWDGLLNGRMFVQIDFNYVDSLSLQAVDHPSMRGGDYIVANARAGWTSADGRWDAELWVKNFTDEVYTPTAFQTDTFFGGQLHVTAPPRWFGGTVRYRWGG